MTEQDRIYNNDLKSKYIYFMIALLIGILLIAPQDVTWTKDRLNYITYAKDSLGIMQRHISEGIFSFFSNEPVFLIFNIVMSYIISPENILRTIIFVSSFGVLYALGKITKYNYWVLFFFLFLPQILINHIMHLRQGLALSMYLFGFISDKKYGKVIKYASAFVHTSLAFIIALELLDTLLKKMKLSYWLRILFSSLLLIAFVFAVPMLAVILGDRRAVEYSFTVANGASGLGFFIWLIAGGFFIWTSNKTRISTISSYGIILYLASYYFLDFSARIFENIIPLILVSILNHERKEIRFAFILFFLIYGTLQWYLNGISLLV